MRRGRQGRTRAWACGRGRQRNQALRSASVACVWSLLAACPRRSQVEEARSLGSVAGTVMLTGDMKGVVRVFQWKATAALPGATPMPALTG